MNGYKCRTMKKAKKTQVHIEPVIFGGGELCVRVVSATGMRLKGPAGGLPAEAADRYCDIQLKKIGGTDEWTSESIFGDGQDEKWPRAKDGWGRFEVHADEVMGARVSPPKLSATVWHGKQRVGDAEFDWPTKLDEAREDGKVNPIIKAPALLRNRRGKKAGTVVIEFKWFNKRREKPSADEAGDVMVGLKMRFSVPPLDPSLRWFDPDTYKPRESGDEASDYDDDDEDYDETEAEDAFGSDEDSEVDEEEEEVLAGGHKTTFMLGTARTAELALSEQLMYNSAMMIHPAFFGYEILPLTSQNPSLLSPVFFNCYLKMGEEAEDDRMPPDGKNRKLRSKYVPIPGAPADLAEEGCPICFSGDRPGCPCCWDFADLLSIMRGVRLAGLGSNASADAISECMVMSQDELSTVMTDEQLSEVKVSSLCAVGFKCVVSV
jgi:hypothetical protein